MNATRAARLRSWALRAPPHRYSQAFLGWAAKALQGSVVSVMRAAAVQGWAARGLPKPSWHPPGAMRSAVLQLSSRLGSGSAGLGRLGCPPDATSGEWSSSGWTPPNSKTEKPMRSARQRGLAVRVLPHRSSQAVLGWAASLQGSTV